MHTTKQLPSKLPIDDDNEYEGDEDILSLCDLQVSRKSNQASHHDGKSVPNKTESHEISSSPIKSSSPRGENQENFFEFFSEEWNIVDTTSTASPTITISKPVIPFPPPEADDEDLVFRRKITTISSKPPNPRTKNVVPRITNPRQKIRSNSTRMSATKPNQPIITKSKSYSSGTSKSIEDQSKVSSASPAKSKLFLVLFGLPPKTQTSTHTMNDLKIRQSRHAPSTFFPSNSGGGGCRDDQDAVTPGRRSENRMWRFIRAVTCSRSQHRDEMSFDA